MQGRRGRIFWVVPVVIVLMIIGYYFYGWKIGAMLHPDATAYDLETLTALASSQIDAGKKSGDFYISGISKNELKEINNYVCSMNGNVSQYIILENTRGGMHIRLKYDISDNFYVYRLYKYKEPLPSDHPRARKLYDKVCEILEEIIRPNMSDYDKELAIHDYLVANCEYGYEDYSKADSFRSYGALLHGKAVCNGYAEAMALLLSCADVENAIMTGSAGGDLHAWNRVKIDGKWYQLDATWDDPVPDRGDYVGHMYFNVTDDIMDDTHIWNHDDFEICDSMEMNYFERHGLICDHNKFEGVVINKAANDINATIEVVLNDYTDGYDFSFMQKIQGLTCYQISSHPEPYGDYVYFIIYLNQRTE